jgi:hypothetical protein
MEHLNISYRYEHETDFEFQCTVPELLIRERYYVLLLIAAFTVQVTNLAQFTQYNTFSKIPPQRYCTLQLCEDMACCLSVQCTVYCTVM